MKFVSRSDFGYTHKFNEKDTYNFNHRHTPHQFELDEILLTCTRSESWATIFETCKIVGDEEWSRSEDEIPSFDSHGTQISFDSPAYTAYDFGSLVEFNWTQLVSKSMQVCKIGPCVVKDLKNLKARTFDQTEPRRINAIYNLVNENQLLDQEKQNKALELPHAAATEDMKPRHHRGVDDFGEQDMKLDQLHTAPKDALEMYARDKSVQSLTALKIEARDKSILSLTANLIEARNKSISSLIADKIRAAGDMGQIGFDNMKEIRIENIQIEFGKTRKVRIEEIQIEFDEMRKIRIEKIYCCEQVRCANVPQQIQP